MPPIPKFLRLKQLVSKIIPSLEKETEEATADALSRAAYKAEFDANPIVYHGSPHNNIEEFIPSKDGLYGPGVYATEDAGFADLFSTGEIPVYGADAPKDFSKVQKAPSIYPLRFRGKLFDKENPQDVLSFLKHENPSIEHMDFSKGWEKNPKKVEYYNYLKNKLNRYLPSDLSNAVKNSGLYTGIKGRGEMSIFDPKNIRGVFAEYNPAKRESKNFMSGIAAATGLGATALGASEAKAESTLNASENYSPSSSNQDFKVYRKESDEQLMDQALKKQKAEVLQALLEANAAYAKTPVDQRFAYQDAPENLKGQGEGGAEESLISPIDFITPNMVVAPAKALGKGAMTVGREAIEAAPRILGNEIGSIGKDIKAFKNLKSLEEAPLPQDMSLLERIKLAAKRSRVKAPEMEAAQAEREALRSQPKDYFDRVREQANQKIFQENEKKMAEEAAARAAYKAEFDVNPTFYHGSPSNKIEEFIPSKEGMAGPGVYATANPEVASEYASGVNAGLGNFLKQNKDTIKAPTVYPIKVRGKLFDRDNAQDVWDLLRHRDASLPNVDFSGEWWTDPNKLKLYNSKIKTLENYPEAVRKSGMYTGFKPDEGNVVVFEPKNIRSPFAKFDPAMKESGDILAGLAAAGLSFDQIKELLNKKSTDKDEL